MRFSAISALLVGLCISTAYAGTAATPATNGKEVHKGYKEHKGEHHGEHHKAKPEQREVRKEHEGKGKHHKGKHEDGSRNHARDFLDSLSTRSDKSKVETVEVPLGTVNTTTTASFQASDVKDGAVIFTWVDATPEFLVGSHLASSDIADGMTKIKNAVNGKTVDRIVVQVPLSTQGSKDFKAIKEAFEVFTTKPQHREFKDGKSYDFWATAEKKGEIGMKSA
jgi:hypothetical protein